MYYRTFLQMKKMLGQLDKWFDATVAYGQQKAFDPNVLLSFRLAQQTSAQQNQTTYNLPE